MEYRLLGQTGIHVSEIALGCWPIAGMTSPGVNDADSLATLAACREEGINFLDTAYAYGADGESERLIASAVRDYRDQVVIATKGGIHWEDGKQVLDSSPARLRWECEQSLLRLNTDRVELLYLHAPDKKTPIADSAGVLKELLDEGKTRSVGASNMTLAQLQEFVAVCPLAAYQPPYNMIERQIEADILPWCREQQISVMAYWPLMKGLLAGKLPRDHVFAEKDSRRKYPQFHGEEWQKNHDLLDRLRPIAAEVGRTLAQLVINWTLHQPGITTALCGAKRPDQLHDNAGASGWRLTDDQLARIDAALDERGTSATRAPV